MLRLREKNPLQRAAFLGLGALSLLVIGVRFYGLWARYFDLNRTDEAAYLLRGLAWLFWHQPLERTWGPLYSAWYGGLSLLMAPEHAFYFSAYLTTLLPPLLLAWWVYRHTRQAFWAWLVGLAYLLSWANHNDWRVNHWLLLWVLLVMGLLPRRSHDLLHPQTGLGLAWAAWLFSYVRPEVMLSALLFAGLTLLGLVWRRPGAREGLPARRWGVYVALLLLFAGVAWRTHPWKDPQGRALGAFGQHFAVRWRVRTHGHFNPYADWPQVLQAQFGEIHSIADAFRRRPDLMAWFVGHNVLGSMRVVAERLTPYLWRRAWYGWALFLLLVVGALAWRFVRRVQGPQRRLWLGWALIVGVWALPFVLATWLFYPRPHYVVIPLALGWGLLGLGAAYAWPLPERVQWRALLIVALGVGVWLPPAYRPQARPLYHTVRLLRAATASAPGCQGVYSGWHPAFFYLADQVRPLDLEAWQQQRARPWPCLVQSTAPPPTLWADVPPNDGGPYAYRGLTLPDGSLWWVRSDVPLPVGNGGGGFSP